MGDVQGGWHGLSGLFQGVCIGGADQDCGSPSPLQLKSLPLCRNILRALTAADLPALERFPRAERVTFKYYLGVLAFLGEEYGKAETELWNAFVNCSGRAAHNQQ